MGWNDAYWNEKQKRAEKAKKHHEDVSTRLHSEIVHSIINTEIWDDTEVNKQKLDNIHGSPAVTVENMDTVSAVLKYGLAQRNRTPGRVAVLNFASYKNPGGAFLAGSGAQEEALCHESTLYEVIGHQTFVPFYDYNNHHKNRALYTNRGLYSKDVVFERDGVQVKADVITVAAPNKRAFMEYNDSAKEEDNDKALASRIRFVRDIVVSHMTNTDAVDNRPLDTVILGAFGCGVFGQNPERVAKLFKETFADVPIKIVYAVIDKGGHHEEGNCAVFKRCAI